MARKKNSKRANNDGSFYYNKQRGVWVGQITIGYGENGKQIRKNATGKTRSEVIVKLAPYMREGKQIEEVPEVGKVREHMMNWLLTYKRRMVSSRTFEKYIRMAKLHILPVIGVFSINNVTKDLIQKLLGDMIDKTYMPDTVNFVKHEICQYFEYCMEEGLIVKNPAANIKVQARRTAKEEPDEPDTDADEEK